MYGFFNDLQKLFLTNSLKNITAFIVKANKVIINKKTEFCTTELSTLKNFKNIGTPIEKDNFYVIIMYSVVFILIF